MNKTRWQMFWEKRARKKRLRKLRKAFKRLGKAAERSANNMKRLLGALSND